MGRRTNVLRRYALVLGIASLGACRTTDSEREELPFLRVPSVTVSQDPGDTMVIRAGPIDEQTARSQILFTMLAGGRSRVELFGPEDVLITDFSDRVPQRAKVTGLTLVAVPHSPGRHRLVVTPNAEEESSSEVTSDSEQPWVIEFDLEMAEFEMPAHPVATRTVRGDGWTWAYPLYGLPRDLVDLPFTLLRRAEFGRLDVKLNKRPLVQSFVMGVTVAGIVIGVTHGYHAADHSFWKALLYVDLYGLLGAGGGVLVGLGVDAAFVPLNGIETALLRSGIDDDYWKMGPRFRVPEAGSTNGDLAADERMLRSDAFFPNWQYLACETKLSNPSLDQIRHGTRITKITLVK